MFSSRFWGNEKGRRKKFQSLVVREASSSHLKSHPYQSPLGFSKRGKKSLGTFMDPGLDPLKFKKCQKRPGLLKSRDPNSSIGLSIKDYGNLKESRGRFNKDFLHIR